MKITKRQITATADTEQYEDDIKEIGQEFTSENTSINSGKLPAVFNLVHFEPGTINIDYGGGRFDNVAEYLTQYDVINLVYDPYNRSAEHNADVIRLIKEHGGADTATCSNVLNVIKEPEVRKNVLQNIKKLVKPNGKVYITVYEGSGKGNEGPTKAGYQLNRKTEGYLDEIREVFPDATRKGKLIVAHNGGVNSSKMINNTQNSITAARRNYGGAYDIDPYQYFTTEELIEFGDKAASQISEELRKDEDVWVQMRDTYIVDYDRVVIEFDVNSDESELSVSFNIDMRRIRKPSDINKYLPLVVDKAVKEYREYYGYMNDVNAAYDFAWNPYEMGPEDPDEPEERISTHEVFDIVINTPITVNNKDNWDYESTEWSGPADTTTKTGSWKSQDYPGLTLMKEVDVMEAVDELLLPYIPAVKGRYNLRAKISLWVDEDDIIYWNEDDGYDFSQVSWNIDMNKSKVNSISVTEIR